jgi:hypothetical protein
VRPGSRHAIQNPHLNSARLFWAESVPGLTQLERRMTDLGKVDSNSSSVSGGIEGELVGVVLVSSRQARTTLALPILTHLHRLPVRFCCASLDDPR